MFYPMDMLDTLGRAPPLAFASYSLGSITINMLNHGLPTRLYGMISKNMYTFRRTGQTRSFGDAKKRIVKQVVGNRIK